VVAHEAAQEVAVWRERVVPGRLPGEDEVVDAAEQTKRRVPRRLRAYDLTRDRV
jgi:hypothetical protein